jgi:hypothetical protein
MTTFTTQDRINAEIMIEPIPFAGLVNVQNEKDLKDKEFTPREEEMTWNLRLVSMEDEDFPEEPYVEIREVYYDQLGKPLGHCLAAMGGKDIAEIKQYLLWAIEALDKPVVTFGE